MTNLHERIKYEVDSNGCWIVVGRKPDDKGYPRVYIKDKTYNAHRYVYMQHIKVDSLPRDVFVLHKCDNRMCVNPEHMFLGSHEDNMRDMQIKNRQVRGSANGKSKLDEADIMLIRDWFYFKIKTQKELAEMFGVSQRQINIIVNRKQWRHT